jgi:DNA-binding response OmpR family regulator
VFQQATHYCDECGQPVEVPDKVASWHEMTLNGRRLSYLDRSTRISPSLAAILRKLMTRPVCSQEGLLMGLDTNAEGGNELIRVHVTGLRKALAQVGAPVKIANEWGVGYRLEPLTSE